MTSALADEENKSARMKQKLMNDVHAKEETRSFLNFSRENLSISHSDLEQGFNRQKFRPSKHTILCTAAFLIAVLCLALETWKLHCSLVNAREIEQIKRDVESLKHRFLEEDLLDELKAFEEQLYAEESNDEDDDANEDDDPGETDIDNADYDSNYDNEEDVSSQDYPSDYKSSPSYGSRPSDFPEAGSTIEPVPSQPEPSSNKELLKFLQEAARNVEAKRGQELGKNVLDIQKTIESERLLEGNKKKVIEGGKNITKHKRDISRLSGKVFFGSSEALKKNHDARQKRFVEEFQHKDEESVKGGRNETRKTISFSTLRENRRIEVDDLNQSAPINASDRHPPKKYNYGHARSDATHVVPAPQEDDLLASQISRSRKRTRGSTEENAGPSSTWRRERRKNAMLSLDQETHEPSIELRERPQSTQTRRAMSRRHLRAPRQVYAMHYSADSTLFSDEDEHTGNGRARHGDGIFKAWRPSDWAVDLGMNRHFTLARDGRLTVNEPGLYLVYAQIHYLDEHDENGFHLLINGRPILQCMIYSPGIGHKSRSCFSAQLALLQTGDVLILKDVGSARYTLFQHDKSFFGLAKLGEPRQQQARHQPQQTPAPQQ